MSKDPSLFGKKLVDELIQFRSGVRSVSLATVSRDGVPEPSHAPYVADDEGRPYIFVSGLARHTRNLQESGHTGLLLLEDEQSATNIFTRKRRYREGLRHETGEWPKSFSIHAVHAQ